ncbi:MAG: YdjY domain-containing protein [Planctomycetes bacterium]|nr:YdjY domain-containing protein [Planctomycetota bacterium]
MSQIKTRIPGFLFALASVLAAAAGCSPNAQPAKSDSDTTLAATSAAPAEIILSKGLSIDRAAGEIRVQGQIALRQGFLEQLVCGKGSREHESLVVVSVPASSIHAALLAANARAGHPGKWSLVPGTANDLRLEPPDGSPVDVEVQYTLRGETRRIPLGEWVEDARHKETFDSKAFVFAGSRFERDGRGGQRYAADVSGSIVGLVTFSDEVIGYSKVIPDQAMVSEPRWQAKTREMPPEGSDVLLILKVAKP